MAAFLSAHWLLLALGGVLFMAFLWWLSCWDIP